MGCLSNTHLDFRKIQQKKLIQKHTFPKGFLKYLMYPFKQEVTAPSIWTMNETWTGTIKSNRSLKIDTASAYLSTNFNKCNFFSGNFKCPVPLCKYEMTDPKLENMNGRLTETLQSNLQILLTPRHVAYFIFIEFQ